MQYRETKEQSGEILRLALKLMGQHAAPFHPVTYAVWYEYVAGLNAPLKQAIDSLLDKARSLDDPDIAGLHGRYIADRDAEAAQRLEADLRRILDEISHHANRAGDHASRYGESLAGHVAQLQNGIDNAAFSRIVRSLLENTLQMHGSVGELRTKLESTSREVQELRDALQRAEGEVLTDPLSGVRNRRGFDRAVREIAADRSEGLAGCALLMADIDHFKRVNDTYGHLFGDQVIRAVAHALRASVKGRDTVARYGGEEFAVLLPDTPVEGARTLAERICVVIEKSRIRRIDNGEYVGGITISIGIAASRAGDEPEALVRRADEALYASKKAGRNRVAVAAAS